MINFLSYCFLFAVLITNCLSLHHAKRGINWNGNNWAMSCDFYGNDLSNARVPANRCGPQCEQTSGCTHFTWTQYMGGTCWMKKGSVSKNDAFSTTDPTMVCGVLDNQNGNQVFR
jgi:hypothetical protein